MKQLTIQDLAMFIGCEFEHTIFEEKKMITMNGWWLSEIEKNDLFKYFKPILRPLSDMTEEEKEEKKKYISSIYWKRDWSIPYAEGYLRGAPEAHEIKWLISKKFDIFDWIEAELAVDKTGKERIKIKTTQDSNGRWWCSTTYAGAIFIFEGETINEVNSLMTKTLEKEEYSGIRIWEDSIPYKI